MVRRKTTIEFLTEVYELVGDEYTVLEPYTNSTTPVKIKHNKCGHEYGVRRWNFIKGSRCPKCANSWGRKKKTTEDVKKELYELVGDEFTLVGEYVNSSTNITLKHEVCGKEFPMRFYNFKARMNCTRCKNAGESVGERNIRLYLEENNYTFEREKEFEGMTNERNLRIDFYLPEYNLAIEFNGEQHYSYDEGYWTEEEYLRQLENDVIKEKYCEDKGIELLIIPYTQRGKEGEIIQRYIDTIENSQDTVATLPEREPEIVFIHSTGAVEVTNNKKKEVRHKGNVTMSPEQMEIREQKLKIKMEMLEIQEQKAYLGK